jgi:hypothetical protein
MSVYYICKENAMLQYQKVNGVSTSKGIKAIDLRKFSNPMCEIAVSGSRKDTKSRVIYQPQLYGI